MIRNNTLLSDKLKLIESSLRTDQPLGIIDHIELKPHQLACIRRMIDIDIYHKVETKMNENETVIVGSNKVGILGDKVGYGKTLTTLSFLMVSKDMEIPLEQTFTIGEGNEMSYISRTYKKYKINDNYCKTNVIIVPNNIYKQWVDELKRTNLKVKEYPSRIKIQKDDDIMSYDVILIGSSRVKDVAPFYNDITFNRVIIDEADSINIADKYRCRMKARFVWLISATYFKIQFCKFNFIEGVNSVQEKIPMMSSVRNDEEFLQKSFQMPFTNHLNYICKIPRSVYALQDQIPAEVLQMLSAGDINGAINRIGGQGVESKNIVEVTISKFKTKIENMEDRIKYYQSRRNITEKSRKEHINSCKKEINSLNTRIESIKERLEEIKKGDQDCTICMDTCENTTIVPCCQSCYCMNCILTWLASGRSDPTCPPCRTSLKANQLIYEVEGEINHNGKREREQEQEQEELTKEQTIINLLKRKPNGKFLIFSDYDATFNILQPLLNQNGIKNKILGGNKEKIERVLEEFKNPTSDCNIIMLNSQYNGAGINIECTTDIILHHKTDEAIEKQIIGRAMRLGRTSELYVHHLTYE